MLALSDVILHEYLEVLGRFLSPDLLREWSEVLTDPDHVVVLEVTERVHVILDDPSDNRFLECALAGEVSAIVSRDRHLLKLNSFRGIPILTPSEFLERF